MSDKVVPFKKKEAKDTMKDIQEANDELEAEMTFEEIMKANEAKKQKLAKERNDANKGVLRSYRIKT
jgi:hypothetical protein